MGNEGRQPPSRQVERIRLAGQSLARPTAAIWTRVLRSEESEALAERKVDPAPCSERRSARPRREWQVFSTSTPEEGRTHVASFLRSGSFPHAARVRRESPPLGELGLC